MDREHRYTGSKILATVKTAILIILFLTLSVIPVLSEEEVHVQEKIVAGTLIAPPFAMKKPSCEWEGLSIELLKLVGFLVLLWLVAGALVWLFESRRNSEMFGDKFVKGLGHGIWWAAVTMTTVGCGDQAPKSFGGRMVAILWMFVSIILISSFTAAITTSLTVNELQGKVRGFHDLPDFRSGSLAYTPILVYLDCLPYQILPLQAFIIFTSPSHSTSLATPIIILSLFI